MLKDELKLLGKGILNVITLGGQSRLDRALARWKAVSLEYQRLINEGKRLSFRLEEVLKTIGILAEDAFSQLNRAQRLLAPVQVRRRQSAKISIGTANQSFARNSRAIAYYESARITAGSIGSGTAVAIGSWTAVTYLGSASTGIGIGVLHGAASTNATLAWFGGGSLATGGAGMAGGTIALGCLAVLPAIAVSSFMTHKKANEINRTSDEIEVANEQNKKSLGVLRGRISQVEEAEPKLREDLMELAWAVQSAQKKLFKFGFASRVWKAMRYRLFGYYYDPSEMHHVEVLAASVDKFLFSFHRDKVAGFLESKN